MWEQYKKTFVGMQVVIRLFSVGVVVLRHNLEQAVVIFFTMQIAAVVGAMWGLRLKQKVQRHLVPVKRA